MAKRETLDKFVKNFLKFDKQVQGKVLDDWQKETTFTFSDAQKLVPVASNTLQISGSVMKARITTQGVESSIQYKQPYASFLNDPLAVSSKGNPIKLKKPGEFSYYSKGTKVNKKQEGKLGYLDIAMERHDQNFVKLTSKIVSQVFNKL